MVKVVVNNGQYKITIPKEIALAKGWSKNTRVLVSLDAEGQVVLRELSKK
jgi:bifunctional DNA-binding transcriptional regulator/antitoxin component of YhaV-PrlF toxin-antitoxin module|tara:strand:+ start:97 stop:246 length:150 start_codon:yes stop_codon:yes gene_type:complete